MTEPLRSPIGTHDVLPPESGQFVQATGTFVEMARCAGYGLAVTPMFEHLEVFQRVGASTDVVRKEMYTFEDRGGRSLALRPEGTAGIVRSYVQHRPLLPWKVCYVAPNFRYERPQKGRYRQHWQLGVEALGLDDPAIDVEVIALANRFFAAMGIDDVQLRINSMGDPTTRPAYRAALVEHFRATIPSPSEAVAELLVANPLRLLDSKDPSLSEAIKSAPALVDYLSDVAGAHFEAVQAGLQRLNISFSLDARLVRGFDYYTGTTFEFSSPRLDAAQDAIGGGGRYDGLAEAMGGPATPGIGFGIGLERLVLATPPAPTASGIEVFVVSMLEDDWFATELVEQLRTAGIACERSFGARSLKSQWKLADRSKAPVAVMLAPSEFERNAIVVKQMATGEQREVTLPALQSYLEELRK